jgi:hypothetical protein
MPEPQLEANQSTAAIPVHVDIYQDALIELVIPVDRVDRCTRNELIKSRALAETNLYSPDCKPYSSSAAGTRLRSRRHAIASD